MTNIGCRAFDKCSHISSIEFSTNMSSIAPYTCYGCERLTTINIPESISSIGDYAFSKCTSLSKVHIPKSIKYIGHCTFSNCVNLSSVIVDDKNIFIEDDAFDETAFNPSFAPLEMPDIEYLIQFKNKNVVDIPADIIDYGITRIPRSIFSDNNH